MQIVEPIHTSTLILREFTNEDVPKVYGMSLESGIRDWIPDQVYRNEDHAMEILEYLMAQYRSLHSPASEPCVLAVCLRDSGRLIGHVGLSPLRGCAEIGYAIEESEQRRGYATQAVSAITRWGHQTFMLPTIFGIVAGANTGSCRVLEKSGFALIKEQSGSLHGWQGVIRTYESSASNEE